MFEHIVDARALSSLYAYAEPRVTHTLSPWNILFIILLSSFLLIVLLSLLTFLLKQNDSAQANSEQIVECPACGLTTMSKPNEQWMCVRKHPPVTMMTQADLEHWRSAAK